MTWWNFSWTLFYVISSDKTNEIKIIPCVLYHEIIWIFVRKTAIWYNGNSVFSKENENIWYLYFRFSIQTKVKIMGSIWMFVLEKKIRRLFWTMVSEKLTLFLWLKRTQKILLSRMGLPTGSTPMAILTILPSKSHFSLKFNKFWNINQFCHFVI